MTLPAEDRFRIVDCGTRFIVQAWMGASWESLRSFPTKDEAEALITGIIEDAARSRRYARREGNRAEADGFR